MCVKKLGWVVLTADSKPSYTVIETVIRTSSFSAKSYIVGISKGKLSTAHLVELPKRGALPTMIQCHVVGLLTMQRCVKHVAAFEICRS